MNQPYVNYGTPTLCSQHEPSWCDTKLAHDYSCAATSLAHSLTLYEHPFLPPNEERNTMHTVRSYHPGIKSCVLHQPFPKWHVRYSGLGLGEFGPLEVYKLPDLAVPTRAIKKGTHAFVNSCQRYFQLIPSLARPLPPPSTTTTLSIYES